MFKKIMVPLDGSALAERALPLAVQIANAGDGQLILFRVVPYFPVLAVDPHLYEEINRLGEDEAVAYLRSVRDDLADQIAVDIRCDIGSAADTILQHVQDNEIDLIVMSSHGRSGFNRWVYGSVAERVLSQAPCPTLIINTRQELQPASPARILVPLDGSELAEKALVPASQLASSLGAELHLLRVAPSSKMPVDTDSHTEMVADLEGKEWQSAQDYLKQQQAAIEDITTGYEVKPTKGDVAETIIDYASDQAMDLIVMSSHGRTGLRRWVYGSVAEKVLRSGCCATMIVRNV